MRDETTHIPSDQIMNRLPNLVKKFRLYPKGKWGGAETNKLIVSDCWRLEV